MLIFVITRVFIPALNILSSSDFTDINESDVGDFDHNEYSSAVFKTDKERQEIKDSVILTDQNKDHCVISFDLQNRLLFHVFTSVACYKINLNCYNLGIQVGN